MHLLVAFGPTWEAIDPVRILTNRSTGTMGIAVAAEALKRDHRVSCVVGPCAQKPLRGARWVAVENSRQLQTALGRLFPSCDALVMAAAVSDYRLKRPLTCKPKRKSHLTLSLEATPDIIGHLARKKGKRYIVGFALESERLLRQARRKLKEKKLDLLVANQVNGTGHPFGDRPVSVFLLDKEGHQTRLRAVSKKALARRLLDRIESHLARWPRR